MAEKERRYRAYLLRLWQERREGKWVWRASLEDPHGNARQGFPDLERLFAFLQKQTEVNSDEEW